MSLLLPFIALTQTFGLFVLLRIMRSAPEGYEDERGFHHANPVEIGSRRGPLG